MWSACRDEYQYAVGRDDDLFLLGRNGRVLVLAQCFFDLLFDFEQGSIQRGGLGGDFGEVRNMGGAAACRECAKHILKAVWRNAGAKMTVTIVFASRYLNTLLQFTCIPYDVRKKLWLTDADQCCYF